MVLQTRARTCAFDYVLDNGNTVQLVLSETLDTVSELMINLTNESSTAPSAPPRFEPRVVYWVENGGQNRRRELVCNAASPLFQANTSMSLSLGGVAGRTTGKRGERLTFPPTGHSSAG